MEQDKVSNNLLGFIKEHYDQLDAEDFEGLFNSSDFECLSARDTGMFAQIANDCGVYPLKGKGVTDVPDYWFGGGYNCQVAVIPSNIKVIRADAFYARPSFPLHIGSIKYEGTRDEFDKIEKEEGWSQYLSGIKVQCTDGQVIL